VTYTQKPKSQVEERIEDTERREIKEEQSESLNSVENKATEIIEEIKPVVKIENNETEVVQKKAMSLPSSAKKSSSGAKIGKYRNLVKVGDKLRRMVLEPSEEEIEAQRQKEKEMERERLEQEQREKEAKKEQEREIARQKAEKEREEEEARKKKEEEERQEKLKMEESARTKIVSL